uniref:Uncharacterized protein n=1 Tax=Setaria italica TaxID=4555 RepID=K4A3J1_SETIT
MVSGGNLASYPNVTCTMEVERLNNAVVNSGGARRQMAG